MNDPDMAQFVMIDLRGTGRLVFGGAFAGGATLGLMKTEDPAEAHGLVRGDGLLGGGEPDRPRPLLWVL